MVLVDVALIVLGLGLAGGGFLFFRTSLYLLGFLFGLSVGLSVFASGSAGEWGIVALVVGPLLGIGLAGIARLVLVAVPGALAGGVAAAVVAGIPLSQIENLADPVVVVGVLLGVVVAYFLETAIAVVVTASWGASLVAIVLGGGVAAVTEGSGASAGDLLGTTYWVVLAVGLLAQAGLWYYLRTNLDDDENAAKFLLRRAGHRISVLRSGSDTAEPAEPRPDAEPRSGSAADGPSDSDTTRGP